MKFFGPLSSIEMGAVHRDDTTERQQHQAPSSQAGRPPHCFTNLSSKPDTIAKANEGLAERQL
jgi:hypothetical protein